MLARLALVQQAQVNGLFRHPSIMDQSQPVLPIGELSPYQTKWMIKGRVTSKSQRRTFNNKSGQPGKVFSVDLLDKFGGEIRASFFNDAVDQYEDMLKTGQC